MGGDRRRVPGVRPVRAAAALLLLAASVLGTQAVVSGPASAQSSGDQQLLDTFAPVMAIRHQKQECEGDERFRPMSVDYVLGRRDVVLRDASGDIVKRAPEAEDLAGLGSEYWLDFPGEALDPGCTYEKWFRSFDATPSIYGRVTKDRGRLVAQYWFYWVFNQWNDLHESDWEMIQLEFDTGDVEKALRRGPVGYAYAQHEGAELAVAGDEKVKLVDGTHPVVYSSGGSHASYYSSTRWFGKSGSTGFGCDDTTGPTDRITPEVIALPRHAPDTGEFAWLSYQGHWGQKAPFFNDGPTGPGAKDRWDAPLEWVDDYGREASVALPFARSGATSTFCSLSARGSALFNQILADPLKVAIAAVLALIALVVVVRFGSRGLLGRAMRTGWRVRHALWPIVLVAFGGAALGLVAEYVIVELTVLGRVVDVVGGSSAWVLPLVTLAGAIVIVPALGWVVAAAVLVEEGDDDGRHALRAAAREHGPALRSGMVLVAVVGITLFIIPLAVVLASIWLLAPAAASRERVGARSALQHSRRLLHGHRWRSLALAVVLCLVLSLAGLVGAVVLLVTTTGFAVAALVAAAVNAFVTPYAALVVAHYYDEVLDERGSELDEPGRHPVEPEAASVAPAPEPRTP